MGIILQCCMFSFRQEHKRIKVYKIANGQFDFQWDNFVNSMLLKLNTLKSKGVFVLIPFPLNSIQQVTVPFMPHTPYQICCHLIPLCYQC